MELILVRHGQPAWATPEGKGRNDPGLTDLGHAQAARVGERLADTEDLPGRGDVDRLFVSPAVRAQETAAPIAATLDLPIETHEWLWELRNPPAWEGAPIEEIEQRFADLQRQGREAWWEGHEGGESLRDFHQRVTTGLRGLLADLGVTPAAEPGLWDLAPPADGPAADRIVAVAHGGTNSTIIAHLLGAAPEPWEWDRFSMGHASVALLTTTPMAGAHIWSLRALGDANHLPVPDRTF
ncbi:histidine phosphatase family protein [Aquihabitans sp. G128]|uniref:histidine phosphatase family protein n=1 Tax=Aquihabitans sp. G128 TaxID=2849779 RepID=UPI001C22DE4B|nr:histidine phosphatase family protein [Aquihabitans sp. G128]QXC60415.1 histidine phosphatase family protein [Aquihabitans sp. G128]